GVDIWGTSDSGHFTMSPRLGNFDMWARVASLGRSPLDNDNISKAGIVVRQDTNAFGRASTFFVNPPNNQPGLPRTDAGRDQGEVAFRVSLNQATAAWPGTSSYVPVQIPFGWVRLKRVDNNLFGFRSLDGVNWTSMGPSLSIGYGDVAYIGFGTTAHVPVANGAGVV